ncbi:MAG: T9SS type A sorting domain-containing protein [Bacteroidales bacterium]|nr:T9SS type A sorting domain-containing protein [Bacteroidales bacterium]
MKIVIRVTFILSLAMNSYNGFSQTDIFELMERTGLTLQQTEHWADGYFEKVGTGQGSGFKQYQRWLYERRFHIDDNGFYITPDAEDKAYYEATRKMGNKSSSSSGWMELGPQNWTYTSGWNPGVGRITSVAVHPSDQTIIYVSSPGGGIWKSTTSGSSWTPLIDFDNSSWMNVFHLCIDPGNTSTLYASLSSGGVLKSTNAGLNWSTTGSGPSGAKQVKVHPSNSNIVFCAASNGIWRSTNGGATWTQVETSTKEDIEFNPSNPVIMYASGSSGTSCVWRSADNGMTWTAISSANGITNTGRTLLACSPNNPNVVYAVQANGSLFGRMYKSIDAGLTYITTVIGNPTSGTNYFGYESTGTGTTGQATYDMAICVNPLDVNEVHIAGIICWKSVNGGTSFVASTVWSYPNSTGYNHADVHALEWINGTIYSGSDGGIYKSVNNANDWTDLSAGLGIRQFYRISCSKTNASVITTGAQDNGSSFRRSDGSWVDWLGADGMDNVISPTNAAIAIGTSQNGAIYKTTNSGTSRINLTQPSSGNWVTPLVMHPTSHDTVYGGWTGVWRSANGGSSWANLSPTITQTLDVLAVAPSNTKYIYTSKGTTLYKTTNGGTSWSSVTAPASITSIFVSKFDPLKIWISCNSTTNRVLVSSDGGTTFTNISIGLPAISARSVVVDENAATIIYLGMNIGVYYKEDNASTWTELASGLPMVAVNEVEIQNSGNKLRVATYGRGVWETDLIEPGILNPAGFTATPVGLTGIGLQWQKNVNNDNVLLAFNTSATFGSPVNGVAYSASSLIPGGGTVIYAGSANSFNQINLQPNTTYFYKLWSVAAGNTYSTGTIQNATTLCSTISSLPWNEIFVNSEVLPNCWSQVDNSGNGQIWQFGILTGQTPNPALTGNYAYLNSDGYGSGNSQNADMISPSLNLTAYSTVTLQFNHYFKSYTGSSGTLFYSINNGATWTLLSTFTSTSPTNPTAFNQAISAVAGQSQVKFKWNYTGTWGWYWAVDDVQVTGTCTSVLPVSVSIVASANPVDEGTPVTFTTTPVNGGASPGYQWRVNGANAGTNDNSFIYVPQNGDMVSCILNSELPCTSNNPANSNTIIMVVNTVPLTVNLQNIILTGNECHDAIQSIYVAGGGTTFSIQNGGSATMIAGQNIKYLPTTTVQSGGYMWGYIAPGGPWCQAPSIPAIALAADKFPRTIEHSSFKIYPNPTSGNFILELTDESPEDKVTVDIYGICGEKVLTKVLNGEIKHEFLLTGMPVGIYFIRVIAGAKAETAKIIKQ